MAKFGTFIVSFHTSLHFWPLQIQWDEPASIVRPDRVSPWEIEPSVAPTSIDVAQPGIKIKRPRPLELPHTGIYIVTLALMFYFFFSLLQAQSLKFCNNWFVADISAASAASPFWYPGSGPTLEVSHVGSIADNQLYWSSEQNNSLSNGVSNTSCRTHLSGAWQHSMLANGPLNMLRDSIEDNKQLTAQSILLDYGSPMSSRASNGLLLDQVNRGNKHAISSTCRLFGIDLRNNSNNTPTSEKDPPNVTSNCADGAPTVHDGSEVDKDQNVEHLNPSEEKKQVQLEALLKDTHKQCLTSSRTRTKVQKIVCLHSLNC